MIMRRFFKQHLVVLFALCSVQASAHDFEADALCYNITNDVAKAVEVDFEEDAGGDEPLFADVNGDDVVDVADVTAVVSVIMGVYNE